MERPTGGTFAGVPSIEVDDVTMEKLRYEADRRGISVERMTKAIVVTGFADVDERIAEAASRDARSRRQSSSSGRGNTPGSTSPSSVSSGFCAGPPGER